MGSKVEPVSFVGRAGELARLEAAMAAVEEALAGAAPYRLAAHLAEVCALGLRAAAELVQLAALRRDAAGVEEARRRAGRLLRVTRRGLVAPDPDAAGWWAVGAAEHGRVHGRASAERWRAAVAAWDELERPYPGAYCRWRLAEALVAERRAAEAVDAARQAHRAAARLRALPLQRELELLAQRARLDLVGLRPEDVGRLPGEDATLGLTARERQVLRLLARGYTNRQVAAELVISVKTASVTSRTSCASSASPAAWRPPRSRSGCSVRPGLSTTSAAAGSARPRSSGSSRG